MCLPLNRNVVRQYHYDITIIIVIIIIIITNSSSREEEVEKRKRRREETERWREEAIEEEVEEWDKEEKEEDVKMKRELWTILVCGDLKKGVSKWCGQGRWAGAIEEVEVRRYYICRGMTDHGMVVNTKEREREQLNIEAQCGIEQISLLKKIKCYFAL
jgi:hypothetical protein